MSRGHQMLVTVAVASIYSRPRDDGRSTLPRVWGLSSLRTTVSDCDEYADSYSIRAGWSVWVLVWVWLDLGLGSGCGTVGLSLGLGLGFRFGFGFGLRYGGFGFGFGVCHL